MRILAISTALVLLIAITANADLIAYYDFGDGNLTDDSSVNSYTLTGPSGTSATITTNGDEIGSAHFDGTGGSSYFGANLNYSAGASFTVSFWWKTDTLDQDTSDSLMSTAPHYTGESWQIDDNGTDIRLNGETDSSITVAQSTLSAGTWYHTALVSDISPAGTNVTLYLTRQGLSTVQQVGTVSDRLFYLDDLVIGGNRVGNLTYDSDIALVKVYDEALGTVTLNALLDEGGDPDPVAHYNFEDGNLTDDETGNYLLTSYDTTKTPNPGGISLQGSYAQFTGDGYLESSGLPSASSSFTVSYWWRCANLAGEPTYGGAGFSTDSGGGADWQLTSIGSNLDFRDTAVIFTTAKSNYPDDAWYHTVVQSQAGSPNVSVWISTEGASLNKVADDVAGNNTDLVMDSFIFGCNRLKNGFGTYDLGEVRIWDVPISTDTIQEVFDLGHLGRPPQGTVIAIQ